MIDLEKVCDVLIDSASIASFPHNIKHKVLLTNEQKDILNFFAAQLPPSFADGLHTLMFTKGVYHSWARAKHLQSQSDKMPIRSRTKVDFPDIPFGLASTIAVMAVAVGMDYLSSIKDRFSLIDEQLDRILGFLYGDKKAELLSEISFIQYAYNNFPFIFVCEEQRQATLVNIQGATKVAMKDIEFYLKDIENVAEIRGNYNAMDKAVSEFNTLAKCLELALQLYAMSSLMEICYSGNVNQAYIKNVKASVCGYVRRCERQILSHESSFKGALKEPKIGQSTVKLADKLDALIELPHDGKESNIVYTTERALDEITAPKTFALTENGELYFCE